MKYRNAWGAMALAVLPVTATVAADGEVGQWYLTPQAGYLWLDNDRNLDDDWLFGLGIGKHLSTNWSLELNLNRSEPEVPGPAKLKFDAASLDLLRVFGREGVASPYFTIGAGALQNNISNVATRDSDDFMAQAGFGLLWRLSERFTLRPEVKARWDDTGALGHATDYIAQVGFQFALGGAKAPAPEPLPPAPAPAPAPAPQPPPPPPPAPVDSDGDGVFDPQDQCPGTPRGVAVDSVGCPRKGSITLEGVNFEVNSATLTADSRALLDNVAQDLRKYPRLKIELQGHTDSTGSDKYNQALSQRRAESVTKHLVDAGVSSSQVTARGYGEAEPIEDNTTAEGRAKNRRVVMKVLDNPGEVKIQGEGTM